MHFLNGTRSIDNIFLTKVYFVFHASQIPIFPIFRVFPKGPKDKRVHLAYLKLVKIWVKLVHLLAVGNHKRLIKKVHHIIAHGFPKKMICNVERNRTCLKKLYEQIYVWILSTHCPFFSRWSIDMTWILGATVWNGCAGYTTSAAGGLIIKRHVDALVIHHFMFL